LEWSKKKPAWRALAAFIKEDNSSVNNACGDCTTTNAVLACALLKKVNSGKAGGMPVVELHNGIEAARKLVLEHINTSARPVSKKQDTINIAEISSNGDKMVSQAIADIFEKVGKDGVITVEAGNTTSPVETDIVQGLSFPNGYLSTYFVTDTKAMTAELENPYIFLINKKLSSIQQILPILEAVVQSGRPLLIIAEDVESEALATLIFNKMRGGLKVCATKAPGFGDRRKDMLEDIAILTGGQLFAEELGMKIESTQLSMLGSAKRVTVHKDKTVIVGGAGDKTELDNRIAAIKIAKEQSTSEYDKEKLQERIGKLCGGVAVIRVGGTTEAEVKERKDRYEDALNATRAALDGGIVIGGGVALYNAKKAL
jgi:chaperonin GroEL